MGRGSATGRRLPGNGGDRPQHPRRRRRPLPCGAQGTDYVASDPQVGRDREARRHRPCDAADRLPTQRLSTARRRMARISTTRSRAGRCIPALSSCRRCSPPPSARTSRAGGSCSASPPAPSCCAGSAWSRRRRSTRPASIRPPCSAALAAAFGVGVALGSDARALEGHARHRRLHGVRHHRISRRRLLDQAHACRLGGAVGPARGVDGPRRLPRAARGARGRARLLQGLRAARRRRISTSSSTGSAQRWIAETITFKPYPCGTMVQPYIDCAIRLRGGGRATRGDRRRSLARPRTATCTGSGSRWR